MPVAELAVLELMLVIDVDPESHPEYEPNQDADSDLQFSLAMNLIWFFTVNSLIESPNFTNTGNSRKIQGSSW